MATTVGSLPIQDPGTIDRLADTTQHTTTEGTVHREVVNIGSPDGTRTGNRAEVLTADPAAGDPALVVRNIPSGTQAISAASLPLPTGAATAAAQLPNSHDVTVDNGAGASAVNIQDGGNTITVDGTVDVSSLPANASVNVAQIAGTNTVTGGTAGTLAVGGILDNDAAITGGNEKPTGIGGRASSAIPTAVSGDGDKVWDWNNRNGAKVVLMAPHVGLNGDPWSLVHEAAQYTTTQTSTSFVAGGASEKIVVTKVQIQAYGTNAGDCIIYFAAAAAYSRGTSRAIFDGTFAPSATLKPGVVLDGPFIAGTNGDDILVTTTNNLNVTISIWYYVVT